jgi:hypothetical protein
MHRPAPLIVIVRESGRSSNHGMACEYRMPRLRGAREAIVHAIRAGMMARYRLAMII